MLAKNHPVIDLKPLDHSDIEPIVKIHLKAFQGFFLSYLGPNFLKTYYHHLLDYPQHIAIGAFASAKLVGFVVGFINPAGFYDSMRKRKVQFGLAALAGLAARPWLIKRFMVNFQRTGNLVQRDIDINKVAELSSLAIDPEQEGRGIGKILVGRFCESAGRSGVEQVTLTTDAYKNEAINRFYQDLGFCLIKTFEAQPGRFLNEYVKSFNPSK